MRKERGRVDVVETLFGELGDIKTHTLAGLSVSATVARASIPNGTRHVQFMGHTYASSATAIGVGLCPYLTILKTTDDGATFTDYSENAQDADNGTDVTLSSLGTLAQGDWVYIGCHRPFAGFHCDMDAANGNASVMSGTYWTGGDWADISLTDNTANGGATFGQDGTVTWTVPSAWKKRNINGKDLYWVRIVVSAALDSSTTVNNIFANAAGRWAILTGQPGLSLTLHRDTYGYAGFEYLTDTGTAQLVANFATGPYESF